MWVVIWTTEGLGDFWHAFDDEKDARAHYDYLCGLERIYTASLCAPIESTDYENPLKRKKLFGIF